MDSYEYILKKIEAKMAEVHNALSVCEAERSLLTKNLSSIKISIEESFKRHMGTLQCRSKWLTCHAEGIFHLKEGSLSQQMAELELISSELESCLQASRGTSIKSEEMKLKAKNVLENVSHISLQPCESGSMSFVAYNDNLEESIINFGDIDAHDHSSEYDLHSDEGVLVIEGPDIKSSGYLTAQQEKEDFERIEVDLQSDIGYMSSQSSMVPSQVCQGEWLRRPRVVDQMESEEVLTDDDESDDIEEDEKSGNVTNLLEKIPSWLIECGESNTWIHSKSSSNEIISTKGDASSDPLLLSKENHLSDNNDNNNNNNNDNNNDNSSSIRFYKRKEGNANMDHMNNILFSPSSNFLRGDVQALSNSLHPLTLLENHEAMMESQTVMLLENREITMEAQTFHSEPSTKSVNSDEVNETIGELDSTFLRGRTPSTNSNSMDLLAPNLKSLHNEYDKVLGCTPTMRSNIAHITGIFDSPAKEYLFVKNVSSDRKVSSTCFIKSTNAVNHMRNLEEKPNEIFLRSDNKTKAIDPEACKWLRRGSSSRDSCTECFDQHECEFNGKCDDKWIKTATDW